MIENKTDSEHESVVRNTRIQRASRSVGRALCLAGLYATEIGRIGGEFIGNDDTPRGEITDGLPQLSTLEKTGKAALVLGGAVGLGVCIVTGFNPAKFAVDVMMQETERSWR